MATNTPITVAYGDGIGPEIMAATLDIIKAAGARIDIEEVEVGERVYLRGINAGIEPSAWESLRRTKVFLKAPITDRKSTRLNSSHTVISYAVFCLKKKKKKNKIDNNRHERHNTQVHVQ